MCYSLKYDTNNLAVKGQGWLFIVWALSEFLYLGIDRSFLSIFISANEPDTSLLLDRRLKKVSKKGSDDLPGLHILLY